MARKPFYFNKPNGSDYEESSKFSYDRGFRSNRYDDKRRSIYGNYLDAHTGISRASSTESLLDDVSIHAASLFHQLDHNQRGFINKEDLFRMNPDWEEDELIEVFQQLDRDKDGCINVDDFKMGMRIMNKAIQCKKDYRKSRSGSYSNWSPPQDTKSHHPFFKNKKPSIARSFDEEHSIFLCQEKICDFYEKIQNCQPELAEYFNDIFESIVNEFKDISKEKQLLNDVFEREKERFEDRMHRLEEEYESQLSLVCSKESRQEIERRDKEYQMVLTIKEEEIYSMKERIKELEELSQKDELPSEFSQQCMELKDEINRLIRENNALQVQLTTSQTECSMVNSDKVTMKQQLTEQIKHLQHERNTLRSFEKDVSTLTKQIQTLREVNRQLQDTNDSLRSAIETSSAAGEIYRSLCTSTAPGAVVRAYGSILTPQSSMEQDNKLMQCDPGIMAAAAAKKAALERFDSCGPASSMIDEHGDSGLSTLRDVAELISEVEPLVHATAKSLKIRSNCNLTDDEVFIENTVHTTTQSQDKTVVDEVDKDDDCSKSSTRSRKKYQKSNRYRRPMNRVQYDNDLQDLNAAKTAKMINMMSNANSISTMPEIIFKIVFAGDASVGKSTFIMRLCSNSFVTDIKATLGIDFRNKTIQVDGKNVGLQLWDTAGQERFRAMSVSYFRKADGVLLLYDSTYEESFIHVRDWVEVIRGSAGDDIPIMLVANKCDLKERYQQEGRKVVNNELAESLAKENNMIFIETSAKNGNNIHESMEKFTRNLIKNHENHQTSSIIEIGKGIDIPKKSSGECCKS